MKNTFCFDSISRLAEHVASILNIMIDGVYISDKKGITLYVNTAYEKLSGLSAEQICGESVVDLTKRGVFNIALNPTVVATKKAASDVQELHNKKVYLQAFPIFLGDEVELVVTFVRDVTSIARLSKQVTQQGKLIQDYHERLSFISEEASKPVETDLLQSQSMQALLNKLKRIAKTDASILLMGETGVGKDVLAKLTHTISNRRDNVFLKVDCGSISENLIESELFGYVSGAFSGATSKGKPGYFEVAHGGTIMLDEIGELPLPMQTRFLRVLQDNEVMRVGDTSPRKVDVRIIAATNINLEEAVEQGRFRKDLYYRLNVAPLHVPALRERHEDIRPFLQYFLDMYNTKYHHQTFFAEETIAILEEYNWPGNVRELQNLVQGFVVNRDMNAILPEDLPPHIHSINKSQETCTCVIPHEGIALSELMSSIETDILQTTVNRLGSINKAAEFFHINRSTIFRKLNKEK